MLRPNILKKNGILFLALVVYSMSAYGAKGFLKGSSINGMNKICNYYRFGSKYTMNIKPHQSCPPISSI